MRFRFTVSFEVKRSGGGEHHHEEPTPMGDTYTSTERAHAYDGPSMGFRIPDSDPEYWDKR